MHEAEKLTRQLPHERAPFVVDRPAAKETGFVPHIARSDGTNRLLRYYCTVELIVHRASEGLPRKQL